MGQVHISEEEFEKYEEVRESGETNMFDVRKVAELSGLENVTVLTIMDNYNQLKEMYKD